MWRFREEKNARWLLDSWLSQSVSSVSQSCPPLCNPVAAAHQASLSITNSGSLLKLLSIKLVMPSSHLILCRPLLPAFSISQHQVAKVLEFQLQPQSFQ